MDKEERILRIGNLIWKALGLHMYPEQAKQMARELVDAIEDAIDSREIGLHNSEAQKQVTEENHK